jgi:GT2 family glycosyltransferase
MQDNSDAPLISIIVLFLPQSPNIQACVDSLERNIPERLSHEVILLANGEPGGGPRLTPRGTTLLRSRANLGFGGGCNWASRHARGRYLVFLNDDAVVLPGWLQGLVAAAEADPLVGAVGSLVLRPDGRVAEAGRVLWREGVSSGVGDGEPPERLAARGVRAAVYCSACSLLVRRAAWDEVGGFDERYYPAYYEDVDLCLALACRGWKVVCAPSSRVVHRQFGSSSAPWRGFIGLRNHRLFVNKWGQHLCQEEPRPADLPSQRQVAAAADRYHRSVSASGAQSGDPDTKPADTTGSIARRGTDRLELLEIEVDRLRAELDLKEQYITHLSDSPTLRRAVASVLAQERRRERLRTLIQRTPFLGPLARRFAAVAHRLGLR